MEVENISCLLSCRLNDTYSYNSINGRYHVIINVNNLISKFGPSCMTCQKFDYIVV